MPQVFALASFVFMATAAVGDASEPSEVWRTLAAESSLVWQGKPLRAGLEEFALRNEVPVWLDRRIDPGRPVSLSVRGSVLKIFEAIAREAGAEAVCDGQLVMIGPPGRTARAVGMIQVQRQRLQSVSRGHPLLTAQAFGWDSLATPTEALAAVERAWDTSVVGAPLPHDLWPSARYDSLDFVAASTLVLSGFDLAIDVSQESPRCVSLAQAPERYGVEYRGLRLPQSVSRQVQQLDAGTMVETVGGRLRVTSTALGHQAIELYRAARSGTPAMRGGESNARFDLVVQNKPAAAVLAALAAQLDVELVIRDGARAASEKLVSVSVKQKTLREIVDEVCAAAGLACEINDGQLRVGS